MLIRTDEKEGDNLQALVGLFAEAMFIVTAG